MGTIIGLKDLREHMDDIAERTKRGESFTVVKRSKPIFELNPISANTEKLDSWLANYIEKNRSLLESLANK